MGWRLCPRWGIDSIWDLVLVETLIAQDCVPVEALIVITRSCPSWGISGSRSCPSWGKDSCVLMSMEGHW